MPDTLDIMRISLQITRFNQPPAQLRDTLIRQAQTAESLGFYGVWVMDHFFQIGFMGPPTDPMLEGYSALNFLSGVTQRVKLGTLVTGVVYRHPGVLLKQVTTLDVLSGGRAYMGIGAAWFEREAKGLGMPFPALKTRFEMLEETLQMARLFWAGKGEAFAGQHYQAAELLCSPLPISQPHPPILIGGGGEQKTLKLVAKYADACNLFGYLPIDVMQHKLDVLKQYCDDAGRDYAKIERTCIDSVDFSKTSASDLLKKLHSLADIGIQHVIFSMPNQHELESLEIMGKIVPEVQEW